MRKFHAGWLPGLLWLCCLNAVGAQEAATRPSAKTITAFVRISDRTDGQLRDALKALADAEAAFERQGHTVETVRIATQPLAEPVAGKSDAVALALLKQFDDLGDRTAFASQSLFNTPLHARS